jgi:hypothetical protein
MLKSDEVNFDLTEEQEEETLNEMQYTHPLKLRVCHTINDTKGIQVLTKCIHFEYEDGYQEGDNYITCKFASCRGYDGYCLKAKK